MNKKSLKEVLPRILAPLGYSTVKDMFFRREGDIFLVVALDKSSFGGQFLIYPGSFVDEEGGLSRPPPYYKGHVVEALAAREPRAVRASIYRTMDLEAPAGDAERISIITDAMVNYGLPFLDSLRTFEGIVDRFRPDGRYLPIVRLALRDILDRRLGLSDDGASN